jgi:hypothetical protein
MKKALSRIHDPGQGPHNNCSAVSYSPTGSPLQYHRR